MASKFHPIYSGVWKDPRLEGAPFECKAFFAWLFSNDAVRPSGIYRVTDQQAAAETELPVGRVRTYFKDIAERGRIVRDGAWVFIRGYLKRQPNHANLLKAARADVDSCTSRVILVAFSLKYPRHSQWSADRLATIAEPLNEIRPQSSAVAVQCIEPSEQSNTEQCDRQPTVGGEAAPAWPSPAALVSLYNATAPDECPEVTTLSPGRLRKAKEYLSHFPDRAWWEETFRQIGKSRFLRGLTPPRNGHERFVADFDWLLTKGKDGSENAVKVFEGKYHD